ncbi:MAG: helix-turn-helix transcriptional regulator [bacterium]|nr:helix-turn-helix transcriptional regulator [bacterium]
MADGRGLGGRLRARRLALGMTLAEVAEQAGLSLPYVSNLERGRGNPTLDALRSLAEALRQPVSDLLGDDAAESTFDPLDLVLDQAPPSLQAFVKTARFRDTASQLAVRHELPEAEMRRRLMIGMASAPRRSTGELAEDDWRRLLDAYSLILSDP